MSETACDEPRHTNGNPAATTNVGARKPEDHRNGGDRAMPRYVYCPGISKRQDVEAPSHTTTVSIPRREEQTSRNPHLILLEVLIRTGTLQHTVQMRNKTMK